MSAKYIGAHMPTGKGLWDAVNRGKEIGCTAIQVFTSSPRQWKSNPIKQEAVDALAKSLKETGIGHEHIVSHDTYLINLCHVEEEKRQQSVDALASELGRCGELGIPFVVSHIGSHKGQGESAIQMAAENIKKILADSPDHVTLLMETTAGQGSSLNSSFEELAKIYEACGSPKNLAVCMDTCHIFVAGYDIRTPETYEATMSRFDELLGCDLIKIIHCNDSKKPLGSRVDRHEHLGDGTIGPDAFRLLVNDPRFENTPIVVETPEAETMHQVNVQRLWDWCD